MKENKKQYWKGVEQLTNHPEFVKYASKEFPQELPYDKGILNENEGGSSRRDFLKLMGFSVAAASLAACEAPVRKAIPYLNKPEEINPGIPNYYASTYTNGGNYCSIVVKTREGRPIKIEPNKLSNVSGKGTSAQVEASVLSLYDKARLSAPLINNSQVDWSELDAQVKTKLESIASGGGQIRIVGKTILSPSTKAVIQEFANRYPGTELVMYDPVSSYGIVKANEDSFGKAVIPTYHFAKAKTVVSFGADFMGTWINPNKFSRDFIKNRKLDGGKKEMSRLYQFESNLSLTGANADYRTPLKPSAEGLAVASLYNLLAGKAGQSEINVEKTEVAYLSKAADDLWESKGNSLVVSGSNDPNVQIIINAINGLLQNIGSTIDLKTPVYFRQGNDEKMEQFVSDLSSGKIQGVIFLNSNPVYDHYLGADIQKALADVNLKVSICERKDETASEVDYVAPDHHYLESWNDANPVEGEYSLCQPTISPLFNTRQAQETLLAWAGKPGVEFYEYVKDYWKDNIFTTQRKQLDFQTFFDRSLHDGVYSVEARAITMEFIVFGGDLNAAASNIASAYKAKSNGVELVLYETVALGDGSQANNPWLQETPDPITKACWDNYLTISQAMANELGVEVIEGNTYQANLTAGGKTVSLPLIVQPGQARETVGLAVGYGRTKAGRVANNLGINAFPFISEINGLSSLNVISGVAVTLTGAMTKVAHTQTHHTFMNREFVVQEAALDTYKNHPEHVFHRPKIAVSDFLEEKLGGEDEKKDGKLQPREISLWKGHDYNNHHWTMAVDLNSCIGCSSCSVACMAENNVPVVGKQEVLNRREMTWIRIDRYYSSEKSATTNAEMEVAAENPEVTFQPMMCQHCNNAPCETVCPVAATTHSTEGLNQMTYNRCIGTRYCANNCPYKVRRFNWFKYHDNKQFADNSSMNNDLGKMVLNPDVTVRSRGVMEKCTFCVQRIQYGKLEAKKKGRRVIDGEVTTACANACPTDAIVFGDIRDPESRVAKLLKVKDKGDRQEIHEHRAYNVLEEINVKPNVWYLAKIRNKEENA
ncbi:MAG: TAT-variant-translocated molybdopterin oxidoreductase [Cytophagales bacterium]|nr:TAT-variant-translocated molybdopterin oxidoreductase [Cytophagales bacterium]